VPTESSQHHCLCSGQQSCFQERYSFYYNNKTSYVRMIEEYVYFVVQFLLFVFVCANGLCIYPDKHEGMEKL